MIYLDEMGHLYSNNSIQELYDFAVKKLKLKPQWNHYSRWFLHFDLTTKNKQRIAFNMGAIKEPTRKLTVDTYRDTRLYYRQFHKKNEHLKYWYECKGLYKQRILRVNFKILGIK